MCFSYIQPQTSNAKTGPKKGEMCHEIISDWMYQMQKKSSFHEPEVNMFTRTRRLMLIKYQNQDDVERLKACFDMYDIPHVVFKTCEFLDGSALWEIYIDRAEYTWNQVMHEVNQIHAVKFRFVSGHYIQNGHLVSS